MCTKDNSSYKNRDFGYDEFVKYKGQQAKKEDTVCPLKGCNVLLNHQIFKTSHFMNS